MGACVHTGDMHEDSVHLGDTLCLEGHCTPGDSMCLEGEQVPERTARAQRDSMFDKGQHLSIKTGVAWRDRMSLEGHMDFRESMCRSESMQQEKGQQTPVGQHVLGGTAAPGHAVPHHYSRWPSSNKENPSPAQAYGGQEFTARLNKR